MDSRYKPRTVDGLVPETYPVIDSDLGRDRAENGLGVAKPEDVRSTPHPEAGSVRGGGQDLT